jgi:O-antigen ligase
MLASWYWSPTLRFTILQTLFVALVGIGMGGIVLLATSDTVIALVVLLMASLTPFVLVIAAYLVGSMKRLFVFVMLLEIPLGVDLNFGFSETIAEGNSVSGFNVSLTTFCLIFLYIWWLAEVANGETDRLPAHYLWDNRPLLAYVLVSALSILVATAIFQSVVELNLLLQGVLLYTYLLYAIRTVKEVFAIVVCLILGLVLQSLIMIALHFIGATIDLGPIAFTVWENSRIAGTLGQPNSAGAYLALVLVATLSVTVLPVRWQYKWLAVAAFGLGVVALLLTLSRGAWIGFAVAITLFWLLLWWRGWISLLVPVLAIICAIPVVFYFRDLLIDRLFGDDNGSAESRVYLMILALRMIRDHWLLGVGANNFIYHLRDYVTPEMTVAWLTTVHNKYLLWQTKDRFLSPLALAFTLALVGWMAHMNFDLFHGRPQVQLMMVVSGLIAALHRIGLDSAHA